MTRMTYYLICILALLTPILRVNAQPVDTLAAIDGLFKSWNTTTPGGAIRVSRGDHIIIEKAYGMADLELNVINTTATLFEAGSVSKQFTAAAALILYLDGKFSLDDEIRKYIPELPDYGQPIKIRHLFNHTSGLKDWGTIGGLSGWPRTTRVYTQALALEIITRQKSLNFLPRLPLLL